MIHGTQKIELTYASVLEALNDYLQKHFDADVTVKVGEWKSKAVFAGGLQTVDVEFSQAEPAKQTVAEWAEANPPMMTGTLEIKTGAHP